jgi:hypothetical protein
MLLTKVYYRSTSYFAMDSTAKGPTCSAKDSPAKGPSCIMLFRQITKYVTKYDTKNDANPHSIEEDTQHIAFLISKQVILYRTRGGTCCPGVSTPMTRYLADLNTTWHDDINHLHHSNHCSNHSIDSHTVNSYLDR